MKEGRDIHKKNKMSPLGFLNKTQLIKKPQNPTGRIQPKANFWNQKV
jgi:hypothetical protein